MNDEAPLQGWNRAIDLIEQRLSQPIDVAELAKAVATSEYHFRRMFATLSGISISEYVRRRRLTVATAEILSGRTVLETAIRYGYGTTDTFSRAFRAMHGLTPTEARKEGAVLHSQPQLRFHLRVEGSKAMKHRIVDKPAFDLLGFATRVPVVYEGHNATIAEFERSIDRGARQQLAALSNGQPRGPISVTQPTDDVPQEGDEVEYWHAVVSSHEPPEGLTHKRVPAGLWVVFENHGPVPEAMQQMWANAAAEWFPANPYEWVPGPQLLSVGELGPDNAATGQLWLPVRATG